MAKRKTETPVMTDSPEMAKDKKTLEFLANKKKEMKESQYRKKFDNLSDEIDANIVNTTVSYGEKLYERSGWGSVMTYTKNALGNTDMNVYPQKLSGRDQNRSGVPVAQEPLAFSKIITAASVLGSKLPDAETFSDSKVYAKTAYELWKRGWRNRLANGNTTLMSTYQNLFTYGWAAWRVYPRRVQVERNGVAKVLFDDVYREPMDPKRTWLGVGTNNYDTFSKFEVYYEKDMPKDQFLAMYPEAEGYDDKLDYCIGVTDEARAENFEKSKTHVTISYYENVLLNRFIVACGEMVIYDGELPNDDSYGSVVVVQCFSRGMNDPYGVGLYEMMRGNTAIYTYINSLNAQQVEAEIFPLLFGAQVQNGTAMYKRGPNIVNPKTPGTSIDVVKTSANLQAGIQFANQQKQNIEDNTGVNNIIAGSSSENTLGSTLILKEAAQNRLVIARNNVVDGLEIDALIANSWTKQLFSVDKVFLISNEDQLQEFKMQNPDYYVESEPIIDESDTFKGFAVAASPNLRLNFDFDEGGKLIEDVPERKVSAKKLYDQLDYYGQLSHYIDFVIDPNSMLLPSEEIQRQQFAEIYPIIQNSISQIFAIRMQDPQAAASQLRSFEQFLKEYRKNIFDYISKVTYEEILAEQLPASQMAMQQINKQMNPEDGEGSAPGQGMTQDGANPMDPQSMEEIPSPQGPVGSVIDGSLGYAASMPMTPNK